MVMTGMIFIGEVDFDVEEGADDDDEVGLEVEVELEGEEDQGDRAIASFTSLECDRQTTNTSCTPANARLSNVQSSSGALQIGSRH